MARVLHILSQRPGRSGSGVFLQAIVREAGRRGHRQHVIAAGPPGTSFAELPGIARGEFTLIAFPAAGAPFPVPGNSDVMPYASTVFSRMTELQVEQYLDVSREAMVRVRERFRPEIVHAHHLWLMTALAREVFSDVPLVATSHNAELRQMVKAPWLAPHVLPGVRAIDRICVLTPQSVRDTIDAYGAERARIVVAGAGYDRELFHLATVTRSATRTRLWREHGVRLPEAPLVTFVGRLSTPKGVPFLLDAAAQLACTTSAGVGMRLVLVGATGSGKDGERVEALVRLTGADVVHVGAQPPQAVALILQCSDLFVLPSLFEGLPLTMLEAAGCGCPCLSSGLPTIRSWVPAQWIADRQFGLVAPLRTTDADVPVAADVPRFVAAIADAIATMLASAASAGEGARSALAARVEPHSWSAVFDRYESVYAGLLGDPVCAAPARRGP
ncbi:MAG: alpha-maltose-phosphate synthase [Solirubrobacteraceae bacterium]|jgi:glycosyltransferase involved in cell wall biosynthesis|nr:alpha-maltose-phosphate synthase [Solirubrobacteraceae bacterium]